jgi:poly(A) polymerase
MIAEKVAARLKLSNKARKRLAIAAVGDLDGGPRALAYWIGKEGAMDRLLLAGDATAAASISDWSVPKLPIGGGSLIKQGLTAGPLVAATLKAVERRWVAEGFPAGDRFAAIVGEALANRP